MLLMGGLSCDLYGWMDGWLVGWMDEEGLGLKII